MRHGLWADIRQHRLMHGHTPFETSPRPFHRHGSIGTVITAVAYRYMRRHGMRTAGQWNAICEVVAQRASGNPRRSYDCVRISTPRDYKHVIFNITDNGECSGARLKVDPHDAMQRLGRMRKSYERRLEHKCELCGFESQYLVQDRWDVFRWDADRRYRGQWIYDKGNKFKVRLCMSCRQKARALMRERDQADQIHDLVTTLDKERLKWQRSQRQAN